MLPHDQYSVITDHSLNYNIDQSFLEFPKNLFNLIYVSVMTYERSVSKYALGNIVLRCDPDHRHFFGHQIYSIIVYQICIYVPLM